MVTGPMPRKPNATRPKANTGGASMSASMPAPIALTDEAIAIRVMIAMPSQNALKLPATKPDRMPSDAPPSCAELTTSRTWRDSVEVNTFTSSGMTAPASVPQVMTVDSFHHSVLSPPMSGIIRYETT